MVKHIFDSGWEISPAGGITGEAFYASYENEKLFLKRNSSPFLAVLSAEGIVPKLVWTKRLESGDTVTAQQWIAGRKLEPEDMAGVRVAKLLNKIHTSKPLLSMLRRIGKSPVQPETLLNELEPQWNEVNNNNPLILSTFQYLRAHVSEVKQNAWSVCHGDVNHNNWLLTDDDQLYLIDWEGAIISDPALDLGPLLYWYIPESEWHIWLDQYGLKLTNQLELRMKWYVIYQTLVAIRMYQKSGKLEESKYWMQYLEMIL